MSVVGKAGVGTSLSSEVCQAVAKFSKFGSFFYKADSLCRKQSAVHVGVVTSSTLHTHRNSGKSTAETSPRILLQEKSRRRLTVFWFLDRVLGCHTRSSLVVSAPRQTVFASASLSHKR